jgi:hypothetical protein
MGRRAAGRFAEWGVFRSLQLLQLRSDTRLIFPLNTRSQAALRKSLLLFGGPLRGDRTLAMAGRLLCCGRTPFRW